MLTIPILALLEHCSGVSLCLNAGMVLGSETLYIYDWDSVVKQNLMWFRSHSSSLVV